MTKLDLVLARLRKLPLERQEAVVEELDFLLEMEEQGGGSVFTAEEWAAIEPTLDEDDEEIPHEQIVAEMNARR